MGGTVNMLETPLDTWLKLIGWFVFGSFFGSFANVVIYRLPLGQSLLWPGSHCPTCNHPIRWYDNVPVFGWLALNGRCRDCRAPISVRYPLVESLFGFMLATLGWLGTSDVRSHLPVPPLAIVSTIPATVWVGYYFLLLGTLTVAALIEQDVQRIPVRLLIFALAFGVLLPLVWSTAELAPLDAELSAGVQRTLLRGLSGIGAGALVGCLAWPSIAHVASRRWPCAVLLEMVTIGTFLGLPAACGIAIMTVLCDLLIALVALVLPPVSRVGWSTWLALATAAWLACWSTILQMVPTFLGSQLQLLVAAGAIVAIAATIDWLIRRAASDRADRG
jgi:leader peptidase (prepilin peptidase)/N-methyltransferase